MHNVQLHQLPRFPNLCGNQTECSCFIKLWRYILFASSNQNYKILHPFSYSFRILIYHLIQQDHHGRDECLMSFIKAFLWTFISCFMSFMITFTAKLARCQLIGTACSKQKQSLCNPRFTRSHFMTHSTWPKKGKFSSLSHSLTLSTAPADTISSGNFPTHIEAEHQRL